MLYSYVNLTISLEIVTFTECKLTHAFFRQIEGSFAFCSETFSSNWLEQECKQTFIIEAIFAF